jgi:hypothetical protein
MQISTRGQPRTDEVKGVGDVVLFAPGDVPIATVVSKNAGLINPISVPGLVCACLRGIELKTCGGVEPNPGQASLICADDGTCGGQTCQVTYGNDVNAGGRIGCNGITNTDYVVSADHDTGEITFAATGAQPVGIVNRSNTAIGTITGNCAVDESDPNKGPDGIPCTDDDPVSVRGTATVAYQTTGTAEAVVVNAGGSGQNIDKDSTCGASTCITTASGNPLSCEALQSSPAGLCLASAFSALNQPTTGDIAVPSKFCAL